MAASNEASVFSGTVNAGRAGVTCQLVILRERVPRGGGGAAAARTSPDRQSSASTDTKNLQAAEA